MGYDPYRQEREVQQQQNADETLQTIINCKRDLKDSFNSMLRYFPELKDGIAEAMLASQDAFDDTFHAMWCENTTKGSINWPTKIPPFELLSFKTPKQTADDAWWKKKRAATNPQTYADKGEAL